MNAILTFDEQISKARREMLLAYDYYLMSGLSQRDRDFQIYAEKQAVYNKLVSQAASQIVD